ncbi:MULTISPECIES: extracellular solute-binding protein [unclassified Paenibacillus]|uniref:extracellular solute-binding protein n=1 Tax=unclassified Paenibacillus TaxID=185978 RepID=UPI002F3F1544
MDKPDKPSRKSFNARLHGMIDRLRSDIYDGRLAPGQYLPSEKMLSEQYQLSNKSVRKGLDMLVEEQLIAKIDRVGSRVLDYIPGSQSTITLGVTSSIERDISLTALLEDFHSLYPDKRVRTVLVKTVSDYADNLKEHLDQFQIDVFTLNNTDFQSIADFGQLHLLEALQADRNLYPFTEDAFYDGGTLYARPLVFSPIILAYNRKHFQEANVPEPDSSWTWDDCLRYAAELTAGGDKFGLYFYLLSDNRWPIFIVQSGMKFEPDEEGSLQLADTRLMECIRLCKRIVTDSKVYPSYVSESSQDVTELFMQDKISMIMTTYMSMNDFKNIDFDISPLPYRYEPRTLLTVIGIAINKHSKNKEMAKLLVDYLASDRAQKIIRERTVSLTARRSVTELQLEPQQGINRPSRFALYREIMSSYRLHREMNLSNESFVGLRQLFKKYWWGLIDDEALCVEVNEMFLRLHAKQITETASKEE